MRRSNTIIMISVVVSLFFSPSVIFSQETNNDISPQQKKAAPEAGVNIETPQAPKDKIDIKSDAIERSIPSYRMRLRDILKEAEEGIKKVDKELGEQEILARNKEREAKVAEVFENGNRLYKEGKFKEAKEEWSKALDISKEPQMRGYIEKAARKAKEEDRRVEAEKREKIRLERKYARKLEAEAREKARLEREAVRKAKAAARDADAKAKASQREAKAEAEAKEKARLVRGPEVFR